MDSSKGSSFTVDLPSLRRRSNPDVPEDVVVQQALLHLNDPNYDLNSIDTYSDRGSFELDDKQMHLSQHHPSHYGGHMSTGHSITDAPSDFDIESRAESRSVDSRMHIRSTDAFEYEE